LIFSINRLINNQKAELLDLLNFGRLKAIAYTTNNVAGVLFNV